MTGGYSKRLKLLEAKMRAEFWTVPVFPAGVPGDVRLRLLEEKYLELKIEGPDPEIEEVNAIPGTECLLMLDFCSGRCPDCRLLEWCPRSRKEHAAAETGWMKKHHDYPPPGRKKRSKAGGSSSSRLAGLMRGTPGDDPGSAGLQDECRGGASGADRKIWLRIELPDILAEAGEGTGRRDPGADRPGSPAGARFGGN